jgi:hypothetical protein
VWLCFFLLPAGNVILFLFARVTCVIIMASTQEKAFCIIQYVKTDTVTSMQQEFCEHYCKDPPHISSLKLKGASTRQMTNTSNTVSAVNFK